MVEYCSQLEGTAKALAASKKRPRSDEKENMYVLKESQFRPAEDDIEERFANRVSGFWSTLASCLING